MNFGNETNKTFFARTAFADGTLGRFAQNTEALARCAAFVWLCSPCWCRLGVQLIPKESGTSFDCLEDAMASQWLDIVF